MLRHSWRSFVAAGALVVLMGLSLWGKLANQYGFFIYPDSYYYLLIAENLRDHLHPTGTLGLGGMPFPPAGYAAMKVTYPLIVAVALAFGVPSEVAGHAVATVAAVLCVPASYWAVRRLVGSRAAGLVAAALMATSFGLTYWSGFIMSDSLSVLLGFTTLALFARKRPDSWANLGDFATGLSLVALLLSRPTYVVAVPFVAWLGVRRWGWTKNRTISAAAVVLFVVSTVAIMWFPPSSFSSRVLGNLAPVLAGAALLAGVALFAAKRLGGISFSSKDGRAALSLALAGAVAIVAVYAVERVTAGAGASFFAGLGRFAPRDVATLVALVPGSVVLARRGRADVAFALNSAAFVLLAVYFWAEPRESRYLIHLLPLLVPVASGVGLLARWRPSGAWSAEKRRMAAVAAALVVVIATSGALAFQLYRSTTTAEASFLRSAYPREVADRIEGHVPPGVTVLSALPWPYYFHLRETTWGAGVVFTQDLAKVLPKDQSVFVIEDASLRFHDRAFAHKIAQGRTALLEFGMPMAYQYGYSAVADPEPVRAYLISVSDLESVVASLTAERSAEASANSSE